MWIIAVLCRLFSGHKNEKKEELTPSRELTGPPENTKQYQRKGEEKGRVNKVRKQNNTIISSDSMYTPMKIRVCKNKELNLLTPPSKTTQPPTHLQKTNW